MKTPFTGKHKMHFQSRHYSARKMNNLWYKYHLKCVLRVIIRGYPSPSMSVGPKNVSGFHFLTGMRQKTSNVGVCRRLVMYNYVVTSTES